MLTQVGNIWNHHADQRPIVITTNIGWKRDGSNPMGAGIAAQASSTFPELPMWYGKRCQKYKASTAVCLYRPANLILFPTKALDIVKPWMSWQADSDINLIVRSAIQLQKLVDILKERKELFSQVGLPLVGCENGNLSAKQVLPILNRYLDDTFILFEKRDQ